MAIPFLVGAYASQPADPADYYGLLAAEPWVDGLEIPFPGPFGGDVGRFAALLAPHWVNVVTAIPGTMGRLGSDPTFGLASPDERGRAAALAHADQVRHGVAALTDAGARVAHVQLHSAPTRVADADAFARSLDTLRARDWSGAELVIEHCDHWTTEHPVEKGFLTLATEIGVATEAGVGIVVNWGRSAIEDRDPDAPLRAIEAARRAGVLAGVVFSGAGQEVSPYAGPWADIHLPATPDEPTSLMTPERIAACAAAASGAAYLGAKLSVPAGAPLPRRVQILRRVAEAAGAAG